MRRRLRAQTAKKNLLGALVHPSRLMVDGVGLVVGPARVVYAALSQ